MTVEELNGILPAVKYRVPAKHLRTRGTTAVFVSLQAGEQLSFQEKWRLDVG